MNKKQAKSEMKYRLIKIILTAMLNDGIINETEFQSIRKKLVKKLNPLIGGLD
jgi:uncharacterized membrane protein YebE (DUF533 family)